jgi:hypothetical protein
LCREFWSVRGLIDGESRMTALLLSRSQFCVGTGAVMPEALAIMRSPARKEPSKWRNGWI